MDLYRLQFSQLCSVVWIRIRRKDISKFYVGPLDSVAERVY